MCAALALSTWSAALRRAVAVVGLLLLAACGGGGEGGIGSGGSGSGIAMTDGRVSGFGSVVVDGTEIEDALATTQVENADGSFANATVRLGQRVQVTRSTVTKNSSTSVTTVIALQAAVVGSVSEIAADVQQVRIAGQWVAVNTQAASGAITVFAGGYGAFSDIQVGDRVEVHGSSVYSSSRGAYVVQATRLEKQSGGDERSGVRIMGRVGAIDAVARSFVMNGLTVRYGQATIVPTSSTLTTDQAVTVWGALSSAGNPTLQATRIRVLPASPNSTTTVDVAAGQISGAIDALDASTRMMQINGVTVNYSGAQLLPSGATPANGAYAIANGSFAADGVLRATSLRLRQQSTSDALPTVRLKGVVSSYVDGSSFVVRGVPVDASAIDVTRACPDVTPGNGTYMEIVASQQLGTDVVKASSLSCQADAQSAPGAFVMRDMRGSVSALDATAQTLQVTGNLSAVSRLSPFVFGPTVPQYTQTMRWTDQTAWGAGVSAATLALGGSVVVSGYMESGVLVARSIRLNGTDDVDKYDVSSPINGWLQYNKSFRNSQAQPPLDVLTVNGGLR